uniref:Dynein regulatory complex protein 12 n=1 Tax=Amphiprion percula TaxID=161767 RepID=A0A3P8T2D3_AMPPE
MHSVRKGDFSGPKSLISQLLKLIAALDLQSESALKSDIVDMTVTPDLSRQYKTMQTELTSKVKRLEKEASQLKEELEQQKREQVEQEKDAIIVDLQHKLDNLETDYEKILIVSCNIRQFKLKTDKSTVLHQNYKELLTEFGLNALDI